MAKVTKTQVREMSDEDIEARIAELSAQRAENLAEAEVLHEIVNERAGTEPVPDENTQAVEAEGVESGEAVGADG